MTTKSEPQAYALGVGCLTLGYLTERPGVSGDGEAAQPVLMHFHGRSAPGKLNSPLVPVSYPLVSGRKTGPAAWRCSPQTASVGSPCTSISLTAGGVEQSIVGKMSALEVLLKYLSQNKRRWTLDTTTN
jgi:hypothetical protein